MERVQQDKRIGNIQIGMLLLNAAAVISISVFVFISTENIRAHFTARQFLDGVVAIPRQPLNDVAVCLVLMAGLVVSFTLRRKALADKPHMLYASFLADLVLSIAIVFILNFNYNGLLLFVFANVVAYTKEMRVRYLLMVLAVGSFLIADYELLSISYPLYSLRDYIAFYGANIQPYLFSVYNLMISMNIILFIVYCIAVIFRQQGRIDEVNVLYQKLTVANHELEQANIRLRDYAAITEKMVETRERNRLAREIHDSLGHTLTGISAGIDACITMIAHSPEKTRRQLDLISRVTREGILDVRRSVSKLRTDAVEPIPLELALGKMIANMSDISDAQINFTNHIGSLRFGEDEETAIYRVVQESLTNAVRHGKATVISITLEKAGQTVYLTVSDNGVGCAAIESGFGLRHIRERIEMLGGTVSFDGSDGFQVHGKIPIRWSHTL